MVESVVYFYFTFCVNSWLRLWSCRQMPTLRSAAFLTNVYTIRWVQVSCIRSPISSLYVCDFLSFYDYSINKIIVISGFHCEEKEICCLWMDKRILNEIRLWPIHVQRKTLVNAVVKLAPKGDVIQASNTHSHDLLKHAGQCWKNVYNGICFLE